MTGCDNIEISTMVQQCRKMLAVNPEPEGKCLDSDKEDIIEASSRFSCFTNLFVDYGLNDDECSPLDMDESWLISPAKFLIVRMILLFWAVSTVAWSLVYMSVLEFVQYLTSLGLLLCTANLALSSVRSVKYWMVTRLNCSDIPKNFTSTWEKVQYLSFSMATTTAFANVLLFWVLIYPRESEYYKGPEFWLTCHTHGVVAIWTSTNLFLSKVRYQLKNFRATLYFYLTYTLYNFICTCLRDKPLYPLLTYQDWMTAVCVIAAIIFLLLAFYVGFGLTFLRVKLISKIKNRSVGKKCAPCDVR
eukprot:856518_1